LASRLITLSNGESGLRTTIHTEIREPSADEVRTLSTASPSSEPQPCLDFIASDESVDRYNEIISATGWKLDNYKRNPVFQNAHQHGDIMHTLGKAIRTEVRTLCEADVRSTASQTSSPFLFQTIEFACDVNPMARIAYGLYRGKFLN